MKPRLPISALVLSAVFLLPAAVPGAKAKAPAPSAAATPPHKVVLLSLDGASAQELQRLHKEGALKAGGFERFFTEGQVADRLLPVDPTITAVNHISLVTGYPPAQTGIVSNRFHPAGAPFLDTVSGFAAPIGTETLWEAVQRQGKQVGVMTWPGADATLLRRTADWGMIYVNDPDREPALVSLQRSSWSRMPPGPMVDDIKSFSPLQRSLAVIGKEGQAGREFDLVAVDETDDGKVSYDAVVPLTSHNHVMLHVGEWGLVSCQTPLMAGPRRLTSCWIKLLSLDPDLGSARIYFNALYTDKVYPPTFALSVGQSDLLWPGPPDDHLFHEALAGRPGIDLATWSEQADRFATFFGDALRLAADRGGWDLLLGYMPVIDDAGHTLLLTEPDQPGYSVERRDQFAAARRAVWQMVDRELARLLKGIDLQKTTVVVVSDHGMAPVRSAIDLNVILRDRKLLAADEDGKIVAAGTRAWATGTGAAAHLYVDPAAPDRNRLIADLKTSLAAWSEEGKRPIARVLTRKEAGAIGLDHPNSGDLILFAADGYTFGSGGLKSGHALSPATEYGTHGYPAATDPRMAGIYLALGAGVKPGSAGTVRNTEVAGRVSQWLGIEKPRPKP